MQGSYFFRKSRPLFLNAGTLRPPPDRAKHGQGGCVFYGSVEWWNGGGLLHSISYGSSFIGLGIFGKAEKAFSRGG